MAMEIPAPLRQLITERNSLKAQIDKIDNDLAMIQDEKAQAIQSYDKKIDELQQKRSLLEVQWKQFNDAVEVMSAQFQLPPDDTEPPQEKDFE